MKSAMTDPSPMCLSAWRLANEGSRMCTRAGFAEPHLRDELITPSGHSGDESGARLLRISQRVADLRDRLAQVVVFDHRVGPERIRQLRSGHDLPCPPHQVHQCIECLAGDRHRLGPLARQQSPLRIEQETAEFVEAGLRGIRFHDISRAFMAGNHAFSLNPCP